MKSKRSLAPWTTEAAREKTRHKGLPCEPAETVEGTEPCRPRCSQPPVTRRTPRRCQWETMVLCVQYIVFDTYGTSTKWVEITLLPFVGWEGGGGNSKNEWNLGSFLRQLFHQGCFTIYNLIDWLLMSNNYTFMGQYILSVYIYSPEQWHVKHISISNWWTCQLRSWGTRL